MDQAKAIHYASTGIVSAFCLLLISGCASDAIEPGLTDKLVKRSESEVLKISFEHESYTYYRYDGELEHDMDYIATIPDIYSESVDLRVYQNGSIRL